MTTVRVTNPDKVAGLLVAIDEGRRTYMGLSRDGSRYHLIQPLEAWHPIVVDGIRRAGDLGCSCQGGTFRGTCYRVAQAEAHEAGKLGPTWFDAPAPASET